jgi:DNA-binding CsgD family transcriptional regulator
VIEAENERLRFSHPMLASIITTQAHPRKLRALHRRIGLTLDDLEMRARHVAFAAEPPDAEAAELLEEAARRALQRGAPASAADLLEHAQRLTPGEDEEGWARRTVDAAFAHAEGGEEGRGQVLAREVIDRARPGPERARALGLLAYWLSDVDLCAVALGEAGEGSPLRPWLEYVRAYSHTMRAELGLGLEHGRIAVAAAEAAGDNDTLARALTTLAEIEGTMCAGDPFPRLRSALDLDEAARVPIILAPQTYLGRWLMRTDELDAAREVLEGQVLRVRELGGEELWPVLGYMLSELEWRAGNWDRAGEYARELEANFSLDDETVLGHEVAHWAQALVDAHRGRLDAARESAAAGVAAASAAGRTGWVIRNQALIGFVELSEGDYRAATATLGPLSAQLAEMGVRDPGVYLIAQNVIEALIGAGDLAGAEAEIAELEERGRALDRPWALSTAARCRGLLFAAQGDLDGALASLEQALVEHERLPMPFERARTLLALGQVRRRLKQRGAARQTLEEAKTIFEELGAVLWATKATDELARIGGRTASTSQLTPTEQRVAELVADGRSNKEVAAALFVTVKTVEANLSRVYAKLGIRSRGELATSLTASKM